MILFRLHSAYIFFFLAVSSCIMHSIQSKATEPNPPMWPSSVKVITSNMSKEEINCIIQETHDPWSNLYETYTSDRHFSSDRFAILFAPGTYRDLNLEVGYYTQIMGLGTSPDDVVFENGGPFVPALNKHLHENGTSLDTFWRAAENFSTNETMMWAVSQASPLRRVHIRKDLYLHDKSAFASGGHIANSQIDGHTHGGGQQQFLYRNVHFGNGASGGAWAMTYVGCSGLVPAAHPGGDNAPTVTVLHKPRVRIEKPYIALKNDSEQFELRVPLPVQIPQMLVGTLYDGSNEESRDFSRVRVVRSNEPVARIQEALDEGKDVVFSPGMYHLSRAIHVRLPNQVLLGLGLATIVAPKDGSPCIKVAPRIPGVRIAGLMLEASEQEEGNRINGESASALLEWGEAASDKTGEQTNPGALFDVFCRVGGATTGSRQSIRVDTMVRIYSSHVYGDNLWLWRADHSELMPSEEPNYPHISSLYYQSEQDDFNVENGIEVHGDDVTIYGLAVEHVNGHHTIWTGDRGLVAFYQCEFPYGVSQAMFDDKQFTGYLIREKVVTHELYAPGIYSNFRNEQVQVRTAIVHPEIEEIRCFNPFIVRLDNHFGIESIVNRKGNAAIDQGKPVRLDVSTVQ